jgi:hypothetical protein
MRKFGAALILSFMVLSGLACATLAECPACSGKTPDWTASAMNFLEGKPEVSQMPSGLNGPQQARLLDAQIDSQKKSNQTSNASSAQTLDSMSRLNLILANISAAPNPSNLGDSIKITAAFGSNRNATSDNLSKITDLTGMMVYADIRNAAGIEVGRLNLKQTSDNEYTGIWDANIAGAYTVTIDASAPQATRTFDEALRIVVNESGNGTGSNSNYAIRRLG